MTDAERQLIRQYYRRNPGFSHQKVADWASDKLKRRIARSVVTKSLSEAFTYVDSKAFKKGDYVYARATDGAHKGEWPDLEAALFEWHSRMNAERVPVTGDLIAATARKIWARLPQYSSLPVPEFSHGWVEGYKKRHQMRARMQHGEAASADLEGSQERMEELREICKPYESRDILNMDETGLFWKATPDKTIAQENLSGKKKEKERITVALTCNADGSEYFEPWIIGKSQNPRAFKKGHKATRGLNFHYRFNNKKWMNTEIFLQYLVWLDNRLQRRSCLLLVDGFSAHEAGVKQFEANGGFRALR